MRRNLTNLRKHLIINKLLDCNKWSTQEILKEVNENQQKHIKSEENPPEITNAIISTLLKDLRDNGIISTEAIPKTEKKGRGPAGDRHWLNVKYDNYFKTLEIFRLGLINEYWKKKIIMLEDFMESPFGKEFLNMDLFHHLEDQIEVTLDIMIKEYLLEIIKVSPLILLDIYEIMDDIVEIYKSSFDIIDHSFYLGPKFLNISLINVFLMRITNIFVTYVAIHRHINKPFEVKNVLYLNLPNSDNYKVQMDLTNSERIIKIIKHDFNED